MSSPIPPSTTRTGLLSASFLALLAVQFLGVVDDALIRVLVVAATEVLFPKRLHAAAVVLPTVCFLLPWILLSPAAGWAADRFSKPRVVVCCKALELFCVIGFVIALDSRDVASICAVTFLFAVQLAICNPAKLGSIPDIVAPDRIPAANASIALAMVAALILGTWYGGRLFDATFPGADVAAVERSLDGARLQLPLFVFVGTASLGLAAGFLLRRTPAANPSASLPLNYFRSMWTDVRSLRLSRQLAIVVLTYAFYWSLGTLAQLAAIGYGTYELKLNKTDSAPLLGMLAVGAAAGSVAAGAWSAGLIELGLVPVGGMLFSLCCWAVLLVPGSYDVAAAALFGIGFAGGLVNVPLYSYIQCRSPASKRGSVLAANNLVVFTGMLAATTAYYLLAAPDVFEKRRPLMTPRGVFLVAGWASLPVALYGLYVARVAVLRTIVGLVFRTIYRIRAVGRENLPEGGALLVSNHISWIDGLLIGLTSPSPPKMLAFAPYFAGPIGRWFADTFGIIPIQPGSRSAVEAVRQARDTIRSGRYVCIFAEGGLSRTGQLLPFQSGFLKILKDTDAPTVPVYLDGLWGSIFSFSEGRFFRKMPQLRRRRIDVCYGPPMTRVDNPAQARRAVEALSFQAAERRKEHAMILTRRFLRECRRSLRRKKAADTTGVELTGGTLLLRTLILRRLLLRDVLRADEPYVGVLLPPSLGGVLANTALAVAGRTTVNLNYTVSADVMNACLRKAGIRRVLTSRKVMQKLDLRLDAELIYLEDFKDRVTLVDKLVAALQTYALPACVLERILGLDRISPDDVLTVIFTSGSTGEPKGVMLSYDNVGSNVAAIDQIVHLRDDDVLAGVLPFFHSFGYTATLWTILTLRPKGVYHFSPLDVRQIGEMCGKHGVTILMATPTFLRSYLRRCTKEEFAALDVVVTGAEKLPTDLADAFEQQFGVRPVEGYGCTELSPLVAVNVPHSRLPRTDQILSREGTVGRPIPGVAAKITDLYTGAELRAEQPGMLWISGSNVMLGYLGEPEKTAEVIRDGWYQTGDVALVDKDGFIKITGRESRFSKIGGEMVPHIRIEEEIARLVGGDDETKVAVTAVADPRRGERLVVVHTPLDRTPEEIGKLLQQVGLPNLWIPGADSYLAVDKIPVLGTGKLDLRALKAVAMEKFSPPAR